MKKFFIILLLSAAFLLLSCGGSETAADIPECSEKLLFPCTDKASGLIWSVPSPHLKNWDDAVFYCESLEENDQEWRLPDIDELRTLIQSCYGTVTGSECRVSEKNKCLSFDLCWSTFCYCELDEDKKYSKFGDLGGFWSSSLSGTEGGAWYINFSEAKIFDDTKENSYRVRCVSDQEN